LNEAIKVKSIHSTMPITLINNDHPDTQESNKRLFEVLKGKANEIQFESSLVHNPGTIEGEVVGGNLSILYSLLGSEACINTEGKILFIEDLDEYLYHIDRMMMALARAGKLDKLKAILIGGMSDMNDNQIPFGKNAIQIIEEHTKDYGYPVVFDFPAGHQKRNFPMVIGEIASLSFNGNVVSFKQ
jgi:muramoyltetrapeptide carboxypeptidase